MKRKLIILAFLSLETIGCILVAVFFYQRYQANRQVLGVENIVQVDTENFIRHTGSDLEYYYELTPSTIENETPPWSNSEIIYTYNQDGLNERFDYQATKPENTYRIIALGDSYTFGHFVSTADNWVEQLEDMLNQDTTDNCSIENFEVINLGMRGYDVPYIVERYNRIGAKYNADLIIWMESNSGFFRANELSQPLIKACDKEREGIIGENPTEEEFLANYSYCWNQAQDTISEMYSNEDILAYLQYYIDSFFSTVEPAKVNFIMFADQPELSSIMAERLKNYPDARVSTELIFSKEDRLPDSHPSIQGHTKIANVAQKIVNETISQVCPQ